MSYGTPPPFTSCLNKSEKDNYGCYKYSLGEGIIVTSVHRSVKGRPIMRGRVGKERMSFFVGPYVFSFLVKYYPIREQRKVSLLQHFKQ